MDKKQFYTDSFENALRMHSDGIEQKDVLNFLVMAAEKAAGIDTTSSILLLDEEGLLRNGASPKLPPDYIKAIDGLKPDPNVGTCAAAAATGNSIMTPSFLADDKWSELRHLPLALGYAGAWSMPIKNENHKVLGTFGTYFREIRQPSEVEIEGVKLLASAAARVLS